MSSDGSIIIAGRAGDYPGGRLYISTDGGSSWNETQPAGNTDVAWSTTSMSQDGAKIIAGYGNNGYTGKLFISTNRGSSWNEIQPAGNKDDLSWTIASMSSDGTKIIAGVSEVGINMDTPFSYLYNARLYISTDGGSTWNQTKPVISPDSINYDISAWSAISVSSDGTKILSGSGDGLYISTDSGTSWSETQPEGYDEYGYLNWGATSMSSNGTKIIAGTNGYYYGRLYIHQQQNANTNISITSPLGGENWQAGTSHNITWESNRALNIKLEYLLIMEQTG